MAHAFLIVLRKYLSILHTDQYICMLAGSSIGLSVNTTLAVWKDLTAAIRILPEYLILVTSGLRSDEASLWLVELLSSGTRFTVKYLFLVYFLHMKAYMYQVFV